MVKRRAHARAAGEGRVDRVATQVAPPPVALEDDSGVDDLDELLGQRRSTPSAAESVRGAPFGVTVWRDA